MLKLTSILWLRMAKPIMFTVLVLSAMPSAMPASDAWNIVATITTPSALT